MKKAFTMIELIFVIVILGILAAVAIPKLNATRDDAEFAKAAQNLATLMSDFASYYTAQGKLADKIDAMTNVPLTVNPDTKGVYKVKNKDCLTFTIAPATGELTIASAAAAAMDNVCSNILSNTATQNILSGTYTCKKYKYAQATGWGVDGAPSVTEAKDIECKAELAKISSPSAGAENTPSFKANIKGAGETVKMNFAGSSVSF